MNNETWFGEMLNDCVFRERANHIDRFKANNDHDL